MNIVALGYKKLREPYIIFILYVDIYNIYHYFGTEGLRRKPSPCQYFKIFHPFLHNDQSTKNY